MLAVLREADFDARVERRTRASDHVLFLAAQTHHDRRAGLLCEERRNDVGNRSGRLAAISPAAVFADEDDVGRLEAQPSGDRVDRLNRALRREVDVQLAVLPVREARAALETLMARVRRDERLVEHQRRFLQARLDIAERPDRIGMFAHRQPAFGVFSELLVGPFEILDLRKWRRLAGRRRGAHPHVAFDARCRRAWAKRRNGIDIERQHVPANLDLLDRFGRSRFVNRAHRKHRLALIERLARQRALAIRVGAERLAHVVDLIFWTRHFFGQQDRLDAWHGQRGARVDAANFRV